MDYLCAKFGNFSFSRFGFIVQTESHAEAHDRYTHATTVGVSKQHYSVSRPNNLNSSTSILILFDASLEILRTIVDRNRLGPIRCISV